ncbi:MAG: 30S ribosomal protein S6 [Planctomycetes bacterium]|nr:30S ribosomal protein S6 [Planctomycetota bacterium]MCA8934922.1 30S ribosomal protein S6 [Planctomycetota bacterium]MCA8945464.1 30S ribosomal protein S6 [Planctomycetota bacterium]
MPDDGMRIYEGLFLVDPGFANKDPEAAVELCKSVLEKHGATIIRAELWAEQRLAYEVRKNKRGAYILTAFRSETLKLAEIELECRLTERILRYLFLNRDGIPIEKWFKRYDAKPGRSRDGDSDSKPEKSEETEEASAAS